MMLEHAKRFAVGGVVMGALFAVVYVVAAYPLGLLAAMAAQVTYALGAIALDIWRDQ